MSHRHSLNPRTLTVTLTLAVLCCAFAAVAQTPPAPPPGQGPGQGLGQRPTGKIAADLGITEQQFIACFGNVRPGPNHAPDSATQRANKARLLPCLQQANPSITNASLDTVMDRYRPEGPMPRR
ncbi:hypothetical protein [Sagittula sp. S175]|uniref:hypothetical protein n=1 Tax=Sagittula sp. S175 TaxID=3415129 RepID=UPI003C7AB17C